MSYNNGPKIVTDGLQLCLDAANKKSYPGSGTAWYDLSGNGRTFNWYTTPSFTDGSIPYFTTLSNRCTGPASNSFGINNSSGYTIIMYAMQNALVDTIAFKFYSSNIYGRGISLSCTWGDDRVYFDQGGCCSGDTRTHVNSGGSQTWNMWGIRRLTGSSTRSIWKNNSMLVNNTAVASDINLTTTAVDLGSSDESGGNSSTWNTRLSIFLVYNRGITDEEMVQNSFALRSRFRI